MDYVFVPVWPIKGLWYFVTSSLFVASFLSVCDCVCVRLFSGEGDSSVGHFGVCYCRSMESDPFIYTRYCIFAPFQVEDVYLVPLVGLACES